MKSVPAAVRILPMDLPGVFADYDGVEDVQRRFFLEELPARERGCYFYREKGLDAQAGAAVLFRCDGRIIASAKLAGKERFKTAKDGIYKGCLYFDVASIKVFEPLDAQAVARIWPRVKRFSHAKFKLDPRGYAAFEGGLRHVQRSAPEPRQKSFPDDTFDDLPIDYSLLGSDAPPRTLTDRSGVKRDPRVRRAVLERAQWKCERKECGTGRSYRGFLDVHHILGAEKSDRIWNCAALCPNCHRESHVAPERDQINARLLTWAKRFRAK